MRELERLFEAMQPHWPVRKYVNNTSPPPPHPLSETAVPEKKPEKRSVRRTVQRDDPARTVEMVDADTQRMSSITRFRRLVGTLKLRNARKLVVAVVGGSVLLVGVAMIVLPGPAILVIPVGLAILATEFIWAGRWLKRAQAMFQKKNKPPPPAPPVTATPDRAIDKNCNS